MAYNLFPNRSNDPAETYQFGEEDWSQYNSPIAGRIRESSNTSSLSLIDQLKQNPTGTMLHNQYITPKSDNIPSYADWASSKGYEQGGFLPDNLETMTRGGSNAMAYLSEHYNLPTSERRGYGPAGGLMNAMNLPGANSIGKVADRYDAAFQAANRGYGPYVAMAGVGAAGLAGVGAAGAGGAAAVPEAGGAFTAAGGGGINAATSLPAGSTLAGEGLMGNASIMGEGALGSGYSGAGVSAGVGGTSLPAIATGTGTALPGAATTLGAAGAPLAATAGTAGGELAGLMTTANMNTLIKAGGGLYQIFQAAKAAGDVKKAQQAMQQALERSDPFGPARAGARDQYMQWQQDPMSYMSSPLAQMQIDQLNRAARAKQAQLGQTWNIGADGGIQGSGIGAVDFATQLQTNLAKQYETALQNRAEQGGMSLFPNMQAFSQIGNNISMANQARTAMGSGAGQVIGAIPDIIIAGKSIYDWLGA